MLNAANILIAILGLALLMVVHECGHHFVARSFGLRVVRFSIGFGPPLWKITPKGSDTEYQIALIPFLAYVQIAGMNPFEEADPNDRGNFANATLTARIATVVGGPLANYLFASVLAFTAFSLFGAPTPPTTVVNIIADTPAAAAQMHHGDKVTRIGKEKIETFDDMRKIILANPNVELEMGVIRDGQEVNLKITPAAKGKNGGGQIGVRPRLYAPVSIGEAAWQSVVFPARVVEGLVVGLARLITQKEKPDVAGPVGIVKVGAQMADAGPYEMLSFLAMLSAYLGGFNLLPFPGLDGGRLAFLSYEAVARRKPNAKIEAQIHAFGLLMFLALIAVVTVQDFQR